MYIKYAADMQFIFFSAAHYLDLESQSILNP